MKLVSQSHTISKASQIPAQICATSAILRTVGFHWGSGPIYCPAWEHTVRKFRSLSRRVRPLFRHLATRSSILFSREPQVPKQQPLPPSSQFRNARSSSFINQLVYEGTSRRPVGDIIIGPTRRISNERDMHSNDNSKSIRADVKSMFVQERNHRHKH
jgi:hypothetical protein